MAKQFDAISETLQQFIAAQHMYFVATAAADGRVNLSPKGLDSLRILGSNRVIWLNVTGSGNETAAHLLENPRMTIMFCAFTGDPMILRLYGTAKAIHQADAQWSELYSHFNPLPGARQIFDVQVETVQTSCGMAVPNYNFADDRSQLTNWATRIGEQGVKDYWQKRNQTSIDGKATLILEKSGVVEQQPK